MAVYDLDDESLAEALDTLAKAQKAFQTLVDTVSSLANWEIKWWIPYTSENGGECTLPGSDARYPTTTSLVPGFQALRNQWLSAIASARLDGAISYQNAAALGTALDAQIAALDGLRSQLRAVIVRRIQCLRRLQAPWNDEDFQDCASAAIGSLRPIGVFDPATGVEDEDPNHNHLVAWRNNMQRQRASLPLPGAIEVWRYNNYGTCNVPAPNGGFVAVATGNDYTLGLRADGSIVAWGANWDGQCNIPARNNGFVAIAAGAYHGLGLKSDGSIVAWGDNYFGQRNVPAPNNGFVAVAGGYGHSLGLKADGSIVAWGLGRRGNRASHTTASALCQRPTTASWRSRGAMSTALV
jgi:hypothetical protein